jgi:hypothetical protein
VNTATYPWEEICSRVREDQDLESLRRRIQDAEAALSIRSRAIRSSSDGAEEMRAIRDAAERLSMIKTQKLQFMTATAKGSE